MSNRNGNKVGKTIAKTRAGVFGVATGDGSYSTKNGTAKSGENRFQHSKKDHNVTDHIRNKKNTGCFITTAACHYKGLLDDCYELEVLRHFRDSYLLSTDDGRDMVDHYYYIAPALAERLVEPSDLEQVWGAVTNCVDAIESARYQEAVAIYKAMVLSLQERFAGGKA